MDIIAKISEELGIKKQQTEAAVKLIDKEEYHFPLLPAIVKK